ncbi:MAG: hypothetical protein WC723_05155 [Candidatus Omnitrophota bacterium]
MEKKRPVGIIILGSFWLLIGVYYGIVNIIGKRLHHFDLVVLPILYLGIGAGILMLKKWARWITLFAMVLLMLSGVLLFNRWLEVIRSLPNSGYRIIAILLFLARFALAGGVIFYLTRVKVKQQFK